MIKEERLFGDNLLVERKIACAPAEHVHGILSTVLTLWTLALMASRHLALDFYMERGCIIRVNPVRAKLEFEYALCFLFNWKDGVSESRRSMHAFLQLWLLKVLFEEAGSRGRFGREQCRRLVFEECVFHVDYIIIMINIFHVD